VIPRTLKRLGLVRAAVIVVALLIAGAVIGYRASVLLRPEPPAFPTGVLRVAVDPSLPPFAYFDASGELVGLDVDLAHALAETLNLPIDVQIYGIDGLYDALYNANVDLVISAIQPEAWRMSDTLYTRAYFDAGLVLVVPSEHTVTAMSDLPGHSLAFAFASEADAEARRWSRRIESFEHRPYELPQHALDAVRLGEADAALVDAVTARLYLREHPLWEPTIHHITHQPLVVAAHIQQPATFRRTDAALASLLEDGTVEMLLDRWL
jgi:ABC-type amino acid transport substrate-binding protein